MFHVLVLQMAMSFGGGASEMHTTPWGTPPKCEGGLSCSCHANEEVAVSPNVVNELLKIQPRRVRGIGWGYHDA